MQMEYIYKTEICLAQNLKYTSNLLAGPMKSRTPHRCTDCDSLKPPAQITLNAQCSELSHAAIKTCSPRNAFISGTIMQVTHNNYFTISTKNSSNILCFCAFPSPTTTVVWIHRCVWMINRLVLMCKNMEHISIDVYKQETG